MSTKIKINKLFMKTYLAIIFINMMFLDNGFSAEANCINGKCEIINSNHYKSVTTYCLQTLNYEKVDTNYSFFTILNTNEQCQVVEFEN